MMKSKLRLISQSAHTAVKRIRRRPYVAGSSVFAAALLSISILASGIGETYSADAAMAARSSDLDMTDVDSLLDARSPGARRYGWLTDSKPRRLVGRPSERVLSSVRPRIPVPSVPDQPAAFVPPAMIGDGEPVVPAGVPGAIGPDGFPAGPIGGSGTPSGPGFVPGVVAPPGGTPNNPENLPTTPPTNPPVQPPVVPAVPEPATWAMLVIGFAMLGATLRQRQSILRLHEAH